MVYHYDFVGIPPSNGFTLGAIFVQRRIAHDVPANGQPLFQVFSVWRGTRYLMVGLVDYHG